MSRHRTRILTAIHVKGHADTADRWRALLKTHGPSDVYVVDNKVPPGRSRLHRCRRR